MSIVTKNALRAALAFFAVMASVASCSKPSSDASPSPTPSASAAPALKPYTSPPAERVGTLAPGSGIPVGQKVPDIHARDLDGKDVSLASFFTKQPILLAFYRGGWCPYCNTEVHSLTTAFPEYQRRGVMPVAVSVDLPDAEAKMKATYTIPFPVLSDSDAKMIGAFHVVRKLGDDEVAQMKGHGVDLERYSGQSHHEIAIPALFLIDRAGVVRWAHSDPDFKVRPSTQQILEAIDAKLDGGT